MLNALSQPDQSHFDVDIANKHIDFIEKFCCYPSGDKMGQPFKMELFQKARLQALFGFVDDNNKRQYNECLIIEGRKNGKTSETGSVELDMLCNDGEGSPQIYNLATQRDQATLGFNACYKMVQKSPLLRKHIRKRASDLYFAYNFGFIKALFCCLLFYLFVNSPLLTAKLKAQSAKKIALNKFQKHLKHHLLIINGVYVFGIYLLFYLLVNSPLLTAKLKAQSAKNSS